MTYIQSRPPFKHARSRGPSRIRAVIIETLGFAEAAEVPPTASGALAFASRFATSGLATPNLPLVDTGKTRQCNYFGPGVIWHLQPGGNITSWLPTPLLRITQGVVARRRKNFRTELIRMLL
jgi:hypothetical protein